MGKRHRKRNTVLIVAAMLLITIVGVRLWLPSFVKKQVNKQLTEIDGYQGYVQDIDLFLIAGEYSIKGIELNKTGGEVPVPFFSAERIDLAVEWSALFNGKIVGEILLEKPKLNFVSGPTEKTSQTDVDNDWINVVDSLMPLKINRFEIRDGEIHYMDFHSDPKIDILMEHVSVAAENLTNAREEDELLPSSVTATAKVYDGLAHMNLKIDPLSETPVFDLNAELTTFDLTHLNEFLRAYGNFDVKKGGFNLYMEAAAKDEKITGYAKPIIKNIEVVEWKDEGGFLQNVWESVVGAAVWVFENKSEDQVATRIEFEGNIENPDINIWSLVGQVLRNAFIQALYPSIENSISIGSVGGELKEGEASDVFKKKEDSNKEEEKGLFKRLFSSGGDDEKN